MQQVMKAVDVYKKYPVIWFHIMDYKKRNWQLKIMCPPLPLRIMGKTGISERRRKFFLATAATIRQQNISLETHLCLMVSSVSYGIIFVLWCPLCLMVSIKRSLYTDPRRRITSRQSFSARQKLSPSRAPCILFCTATRGTDYSAFTCCL